MDPNALPVSSVTPEIGQLSAPAPSRILFVGNSYFYYNDSLHNHVQRMVAEAGLIERRDLTYKSATIGGAMLSDHPIDHLLDPDNLRVSEPFQTVIMQGISSAALTPERRANFASTAADYAQRVRAAGGEPVLYMTPAYVPPHAQYRPDMISEIASLYIATGNEIDALVIPVGLAFEEAYRRRPDIVLHKAFDGSHPSLLGTYLAAATVFASIYESSPVGNGYDYFGAVSEADALFLQSVADETVREFYGRD
ncbi:hypothetical protein AAV99_12600 [Aurantiacibacter marinus]|uniref:SGNH hydrolase-type esterase domain-containing protein n=1 Tax=Aurantiacibacter marinus TaxID=874156 RepID=A0A0H0XM47_9SPHN|nr:hypothetical protein AAV99_12600 [Aurantiacibacter marinus]